jgi:hypothetical protein
VAWNGAVRNPNVRSTDAQPPRILLDSGVRMQEWGRHGGGRHAGRVHNVKASAMYPADSLRSRTFLERQGGHVATLMDCSRRNCVAQPEDNLPSDLRTPKVGPYDRYAVMWGHKPIPGATIRGRTGTSPTHRRRRPSGWGSSRRPHSPSTPTGGWR